MVVVGLFGNLVGNLGASGSVLRVVGGYLYSVCVGSGDVTVLFVVDLRPVRQLESHVFKLAAICTYA